MSVKSYLIKGAVICDSAQPEKKDIYVEGGIIHQIGEALTVAPGTEVLDVQGARVSAGWFDLRCRLSDPGFEEREDLISGTLAAAAGGFTDIACLIIFCQVPVIRLHGFILWGPLLSNLKAKNCRKCMT